MSQPVLYFLALHVPGTSDKGLHITLALIHKARFDEDPANAKKDMAELAEAILPLPIQFGAKEMFGQNKDVSVRLVGIPDKPKRFIHQFGQKYYTAMPSGQPDFGPSQTFHCTTKGLPEAEAAALTTARLSRMFLARVGGKGEAPLWTHGE